MMNYLIPTNIQLDPQFTVLITYVIFDTILLYGLLRNGLSVFGGYEVEKNKKILNGVLRFVDCFITFLCICK